MAGYHCLMPTAFILLQYTQHITAIGISSGATHPTHNGYQHLFRCNTNQYITAIGIYSFQYNPNITAFHPIHYKPNIIPNGIPSVVSQSPNLTAECAPERGNEPLAQGTALGNLEQHKMIRPDRAKAPHTIQHPRRRLGLYDCWSFRPPLYGRVFIDWLL